MCLCSMRHIMTSLETNRYLNIIITIVLLCAQFICGLHHTSKLLLHIIIGIIIHTQECLISNLLMFNLKIMNSVKL